jgi:hypothetical protein
MEPLSEYENPTNSAFPDPSSRSVALAKLQNPLKSSFDKVNDDLKKIHKGHRDYGKALDRVCTAELQGAYMLSTQIGPSGKVSPNGIRCSCISALFDQQSYCHASPQRRAIFSVLYLSR